MFYVAFLFSSRHLSDYTFAIQRHDDDKQRETPSYREWGIGKEVASLASGTVNLDAMIPRENFFVEEGGSSDLGRQGNELYLSSLTDDGRISTYRKPDFQRETSAWKPEIVAEFIRSVVDGDVIPSVIMWKSEKSGKIFVIDGAHRLSALIAWIRDDYGDRAQSQEFFGFSPDRARTAADAKTRALISADVGNFRALRAYANNPDSAPNEKQLRRSRRIANDPIYIQWIVGDAAAAEKSFVRINSTAVPINDTEKLLIAARRKPNGLAARALMRAGTGHEYWSEFEASVRSEIKTLAGDIYDQLIRPLVEYPIVALDLPAADRGYSADSVKTILDLVTYVNAPSAFEPGKKKAAPLSNEDDKDGSEAVAYLNRIKTATARVFGRHSGSLALHPGVYCYGVTGKFIPKAFIGAIGFVGELERRNKFFEFTTHRAAFEEFLLDHRYFVNQIGSGQGSGGTRGIPAVIRLNNLVFEKIAAGKTAEGIIEALKSHESLSFLYVPNESDHKSGRKFTRDDAAAVMLRESLSAETRCKVCGAHLYRKRCPDPTFP